MGPDTLYSYRFILFKRFVELGPAEDITKHRGERRNLLRIIVIQKRTNRVDVGSYF